MSRLNAYSRQAANIPPGTTQFTKIDVLPDGKYTFEIRKATLKELPQGDLFAMQIVPLDGVMQGKEIDYDNWLSGTNREGVFGVSERAVGRLKEELNVLGIDYATWGEFDFWQGFAKAIETFPGRRFVGEKSTNKAGQKTYHNLKFLESRQSGPRPESAPLPATAKADDIPFGFVIGLIASALTMLA